MTTLRPNAVKLLAGSTVVILVGFYAWLLATAMTNGPYNVWGALGWIPPLVLLNLPLLAAVARREGDRWLAGLLLAGFVLKLVGAAVRYWVAFVVYNGVADANGYNLYAVSQLLSWRRGFFEWTFATGFKTGTAFVNVLTTAVYTVFGPSPIVGFVVFALMSFWGQYFMFRAFRVGLPDANPRRYAALIFLLPSFLYWPSSMGKEAWLMLTIGLMVLGIAHVFARHPWGWLLVALGAAGTSGVRPHFAAMILAAAVLAQAFRPIVGHPIGSLLGKLGGLSVMVGVAALVTVSSAGFLRLDHLTIDGIATAIDDASNQTAQGGSAFTPVPITNPFGVPAALVTVLFRPFPWEARNPQVMVTALEGVLLVALLIGAWPRLRHLGHYLKTRSYVVFSLAYMMLFVYAFSGFGNFGILARQRVLVLPFLVVLLCLPDPPKKRLANSFAVRRTLSRAYE